MDSYQCGVMSPGPVQDCSQHSYGCTTWTLTKRLEKKLDGNYTRMLRAILNKSWRQHPTRHQLYGHLPPITKTIQVRRTRHSKLYLSLIGIILRWGFLIWELILYLLRTFCPHLGSFFFLFFFFVLFLLSLRFGQISPRLSIPIRGRGKSPEEGQRWNLAET